jgi:hypothetical protein
MRIYHAKAERGAPADRQDLSGREELLHGRGRGLQSAAGHSAQQSGVATTRAIAAIAHRGNLYGTAQLQIGRRRVGVRPQLGQAAQRRRVADGFVLHIQRDTGHCESTAGRQSAPRVLG